jgi:N utilization substance protein B
MNGCVDVHQDEPNILDQTFSYNDLSRREVRSLIFHLLYAMDAFDYDVSLQGVVDNFNRGFNIAIPFDSEVFKVAQSVIENRQMLDDAIKPLLHNWRFDRIGVCTKLILRLALWELHNTQTSANIVLNEAIELAKCFAERDAYKFVNGILDEAVKKMGREAEMETAQAAAEEAG